MATFCSSITFRVFKIGLWCFKDAVNKSLNLMEAIVRLREIKKFNITGNLLNFSQNGENPVYCEHNLHGIPQVKIY